MPHGLIFTFLLCSTLNLHLSGEFSHWMYFLVKCFFCWVREYFVGPRGKLGMSKVFGHSLTSFKNYTCFTSLIFETHGKILDNAGERCEVGNW